MRGSNEQTAPRVYYTDPMKEEPAAAVHTAASLDFTHVMIPPPWRTVTHHDRFLAASLEEPDSALPADASLPGMVLLVEEAGLGLLIDVVLDRVAAQVVSNNTTIFAVPDAAALLDPRRGLAADVATAHLEESAQAGALGAWWGQHLARWRRQGAAGFRLLGLAACPDYALPSLLAPLRVATGDGLLLAWTPGMTPDQTEALAGTALDGVFGSLPWWDFRASWFWEEVGRLRKVAPLIGASAAPLGPSAVGDAGLAVAALVGAGWMVTGGTQTRAAYIAGLNRIVATAAPYTSNGTLNPLTAPGTSLLAVLCTDGTDVRYANHALLAVLNIDAAQPLSVDPESLLPAAGGFFAKFVAAYPDDGFVLDATTPIELQAGECRIYRAEAEPFVVKAGMPTVANASDAAAIPRLGIEAIAPAVDSGVYPVKRTMGERVEVEADVVFDGHEKIAVALQWRGPGEVGWNEARMRDMGNDRWRGAFPMRRLGRHEYTVVAWRDRFASFRDELGKKFEAGVAIDLECIEGMALVQAAYRRSTDDLKLQLGDICARLERSDAATVRDQLLSEPLSALMARADDRPFHSRSTIMHVDAERIGARFASWYEVFPRSLSDDPARHGTFADVVRHLPRIRDMGFDVLYFPPIHPIGRINRKGPNNSLTPGPDDPGSPYAIGATEGGHDALHTELGGFDDFQALRREAAVHGLELAMDFAIQCAPDHPWLTQHKGWFDWRPDGTIKYAENPPKKYQDIVNVDFYAEDSIPALWLELCRIVLFWAEQGVRLFRVDNPHTKPFPFWEWMIGEVRARYPDAVFLAEAFTRPKIMYRLAKIGFSQSYTYFTWRNSKRELVAYFSELADGAPREFFRPHLFVNTPDINPPFLQTSGRPGFLIRAALAATLSGLWGIYNGFELCESAALPGREEYRDSEKYQLRQWDWERPGNIVPDIAVLNRIRRENPALQTHLGVKFLNAWNDAVIYYEKATTDRSNVVLITVSLDPFQPQGCEFEVPLWSWALPDTARVEAEDLVSGELVIWHGKVQRAYLTPERPYMIWRVRPV
jgi:starch synthase (maltosyl-transferring)